MSSRSFIPLAIVVLTIAAAIGAWLIYFPSESQRYNATRSVSRTSSVIRIEFTVAHQRGAIGREKFTFTNDNGHADVAYEGTNLAGTLVARFTEPLDGYLVANLFGQVVRDGIWDLRTMPPRGDTTTTYTISVYQLTDNKSGNNRFTFTDPHYWATTGGRQYRIHLDKNKPVPDLLKLQSTSLAEPRFAALVQDFENFSAPGFRATLATARAKLRAA